MFYDDALNFLVNSPVGSYFALISFHWSGFFISKWSIILRDFRFWFALHFEQFVLSVCVKVNKKKLDNCINQNYAINLRLGVLFLIPCPHLCTVLCPTCILCNCWEFGRSSTNCQHQNFLILMIAHSQKWQKMQRERKCWVSF